MDAEHEEVAEAKPEPQRIVTDWKRFACGLWRMPQGDISSAYCADIFPKLKTFTHEGRVYTNAGHLFSGAVRSFVNCYPLILPDEYDGPESVQYSYEGKTGTFNRKAYRLGPKVIFISSDPTVHEWTGLFRVIYADGGMFVHGLTYLEFLERSTPKTENEYAALHAEVAHCANGDMPQTQHEMKDFLEGLTLVAIPAADSQMELCL